MVTQFLRPKRAATVRPRRRPVRLALVDLEDRTVLTSFTIVLDTFLGEVGSQVRTVAQFESADTITVAVFTPGALAVSISSDPDFKPDPAARSDSDEMESTISVQEETPVSAALFGAMLGMVEVPTTDLAPAPANVQSADALATQATVATPVTPATAPRQSQVMRDAAFAPVAVATNAAPASVREFDPSRLSTANLGAAPATLTLPRSGGTGAEAVRLTESRFNTPPIPALNGGGSVRDAEVPPAPTPGPVPARPTHVVPPRTADPRPIKTEGGVVVVTDEKAEQLPAANGLNAVWAGLAAAAGLFAGIYWRAVTRARRALSLRVRGPSDVP